MSENGKESSPLKLYQSAYELHYKKHKLADACELYEELIKRFPDADVSAYASIQLQKVRADKTTRSLAGRHVLKLLIISLLIVNLLATIACVTVTVFFVRRAEDYQQKMAVFTRALAKAQAGKDDEALSLLKNVKIQYPEDITSFAVAAEIYRKSHEYLKARKEYETYRRLNPQDPLAEIEIESINEEEDIYIGAAMKEREKKKIIPEEVIRAEDNKTAQRAEQKLKKTPRAIPPVRNKVKLLLPKDSVSFF